MNFPRKIFSLFFLIIICAGCSPQIENKPLKVMSFNIRYDNPADGPNAWTHRKEIVVEEIKIRAVDIVGMQEVLKGQEKYLIANLPEYETYGVGRDDGADKGELCPIFFRRQRFELLEKSTFWLSETPDSIGSKAWDAVLPRIVSWVKLHDLETGEDLYFFNTHFSHVSDSARKNSAELLVKKITEIAGNQPVILSGDFNCINQSEPYQVLTGNSQNLLQLFDTHYISETEHFGGLQSINGFGRSRRETIIDFLFCNSAFRVLNHGILTVRKDSVFISDHYPVLATVVLAENKDNDIRKPG